MKVNVIEFRQRPSGGRRGFVDVELPELGLVLRDVVVFSGHRGAWVKMPARRVAIDEQTVEYHPYLEFSPSLAEAVQSAILRAVVG